MNNSKKRFKIDQNLYEELTCSEIIERYEPFITKKAYNYTTYATTKFYKHVAFIEFEDVKQHAYMGIIKAYEEYDIEKGFIFFTYMQWIVNGAVQRYVRDITKVRLKRPSPYDFKDVYLDADYNAGGDADIHISEIISDPNDDINDFIEEDFLTNLLSLLDEKQTTFINLMYVEGKTQWDIAHMFDTSQANVSRTIRKALLKMREHIGKIKKSEEYNMAKFKPSQIEVVKYLVDNADNTLSFSTAVQKYAKKLGLSGTTIFNIIKESGKSDALKPLYKDNKPKIVKIAESETSATKEEPVYYSTDFATMPEYPTANTLSVVKNESSISIEELRVENSNPLDGVVVDKLSVTLADGTYVEYMGKEVKVNNNTTWLNREQLVNYDKSLNKALEIYDYLYK